MEAHEKEVLAKAIIELINKDAGVQRTVLNCVLSCPNIVVQI